MKRDQELLAEISGTTASAPALWWLGHSGFVLKFESMIFYVDPCLSNRNGRPRVFDSLLSPSQVGNADMVLCTHEHEYHMDPGSLPEILKASPRAKVILPKSTAATAQASGIPYERMTTTDSGLRVEYFKGGPYARVYSVPSAHPELSWTPLGGYPSLGYLIRFGNCTIYHSGDCRLYDGLAGMLRPYNVTAALLPIDGDGNFEIAEAAQLAEDIGARWLIPMHYGTFVDQKTDVNRFVDHMLGFRPSMGFKVLQPGQGWLIPD